MGIVFLTSSQRCQIAVSRDKPAVVVVLAPIQQSCRDGARGQKSRPRCGGRGARVLLMPPACGEETVVDAVRVN